MGRVWVRVGGVCVRERWDAPHVTPEMCRRSGIASCGGTSRRYPTLDTSVGSAHVSHTYRVAVMCGSCTLAPLEDCSSKPEGARRLVPCPHQVTIPVLAVFTVDEACSRAIHRATIPR